MNKGQVLWMNGVEILAAKAVYKRFRVNRYQLNILCSISTYLSLKGRKACSANKLFDWLGVNSAWRYRAKGYIKGLEENGCLHQLYYKVQVKSHSLAISEFGARVLDLYWQEMKRLEKQRPKRYDTDKSVNAANIARDLPTYILVSAGRDN